MADKKQLIKDARNWLMDHDIQFIEPTNSYGQFNIFRISGELLCVWWSTAEHMKPQNNSAEHYHGAENIQRQIQQWYLKDIQEGQKGVSDIRKAFESYSLRIAGARKLVTVTELKSGALEVQINDSDLKNKYQYILDAYDSQMKLKTCPEIRILDFCIV